MKILDIKTVSEMSGLPPSALRYYEERGLIKSVGRQGLRRQYDPLVITQLQPIALGKMAGFSLDEIQGIFGPDGRPELPREALLQRADELDRQISELGALRDSLRHVAYCDAPSHLECNSFQTLLRLATRQVTRRKARK